jgi:HAD superfamily hydrolase (TIGR01509 family)
LSRSVPLLVTVAIVIRAVVLDFDGLILDTERPVYESWRWAFSQHGLELPLQEWSELIGRVEAWDPLERLSSLAPTVDSDVMARRQEVRDTLLAAESVLPGVVELIASAREMGMPVGIASSSPLSWVAGHLERLGLVESFDCVTCWREGVQGKPAPDLYAEAAGLLGAAPSECIAFEDSMNGVLAAKAAGMRCVAVPHGLTAHLDLSAADLIVESLAEVSLRQLADQWSLPMRPEGA